MLHITRLLSCDSQFMHVFTRLTQTKWPHIYRLQPPLLCVLSFRLGAPCIRVETDRWIPSKPPRDRCICQHWHMQNEQHFLFDCPYVDTLGNGMTFFLASTRVALASSLRAVLTKCHLFDFNPAAVGSGSTFLLPRLLPSSCRMRQHLTLTLYCKC